MTLNLSTSFDSLYRCFDNIVGDEIAFTLSLSTFFFFSDFTRKYSECRFIINDEDNEGTMTTLHTSQHQPARDY